MKRHRVPVRICWRDTVEKQGLLWHTQDGRTYWDESVAYEFTAAEVDQLEAAAAEWHGIYLEAAAQIVRNGWWKDVGISAEHVPLITKSWENQEFSLYGRFDAVIDETGQPKLLEYNADTPTSLLESSVIQWHWLEQTRRHEDQFNSLHEKLIAAWKRSGLKRVHFSSVADCPEDEMTVVYLQDTAMQAGIETVSIPIDQIGWNTEVNAFVDEAEEPIAALFKLYPWEGMLRDAFARYIPGSACRFLEPPWKLLLSNKGILPILWELFPDHPSLLPAFREPGPLGNSYVKKPVHSREGANITIVENGVPTITEPGPYGDTGYIYHAIARALPHDGNWPALGLWIVDGEPAGMGIREDTSRITGNLSRFVPHWFRRA
jgi:glutathionylspermidine synthase